ncbi:MAG: hypothetical protein V4731_12545 [Pseudomonadota bacterium]
MDVSLLPYECSHHGARLTRALVDQRLQVVHFSVLWTVLMFQSWLAAHSIRGAGS